MILFILMEGAALRRLHPILLPHDVLVLFYNHDKSRGTM